MDRRLILWAATLAASPCLNVYSYIHTFSGIMKKKRPIQLYLDPEDRARLERLAAELGLSMAETLRWGLRRLAAEQSGEDDPLMKLMGSIDDPDLPRDLSTRHDEYFVEGYPPRRVAEDPPERRGID